MSAVVQEARRWLGTPYQHQASCLGAGTDCLGLVRGVWRAVYGREPELVPPYTADWAEPERAERLLEACQRHLVAVQGPVAEGQLLLFRMREGAVAKHLGIASGPDRFLHAYTGHGVIDSPLSAPWARRIVAQFLFP